MKTTFTKLMIRSLLVLLCFFTYQLLNAQNDSTSADTVQIKVGAFYNSNLNYYGRTDSLRSSGFFPAGAKFIF